MSCADKGCSNRARIVGIGACRRVRLGSSQQKRSSGRDVGMLGYQGQACVYVDVRLDCDCDGRLILEWVFFRGEMPVLV